MGLWEALLHVASTAERRSSSATDPSGSRETSTGRCQVSSAASQQGTSAEANAQVMPSALYPRPAEVAVDLARDARGETVCYSQVSLLDASSLQESSPYTHDVLSAECHSTSVAAVRYHTASSGRYQANKLASLSQLFGKALPPGYDGYGQCVSRQVFPQIAAPKRGLRYLTDTLVLKLFSILSVRRGWSGTGEEDALALAETCVRFYHLYSTSFVRNWLMANNNDLSHAQIAKMYRDFPLLQCVCFDNCPGIDDNRKHICIHRAPPQGNSPEGVARI